MVDLFSCNIFSLLQNKHKNWNHIFSLLKTTTKRLYCIKTEINKIIKIIVMFLLEHFYFFTKVILFWCSSEGNVLSCYCTIKHFDKWDVKSWYTLYISLNFFLEMYDKNCTLQIYVFYDSVQIVLYFFLLRQG